MAGLLTLSLVSVVMPSIEAIALATGGIEVSRKSWIKIFRVVFWCLYLIVASITIGIAASNSKFADEILNPAYAVLSFLLAVFYGIVSNRFSTFSTRESSARIENQQQQEHIRQRCGEIRQSALIYTICLIIMTLFFGTQIGSMMRWGMRVMLDLWIFFLDHLVSFHFISFMILNV